MAKKVPKIVREIKKFVPHEINYAFDRQLSFSQIQVYNNCPYRWKLQYVDKKKLFRSNIYTVFGSAMHDAIQNYLQVLYDTSKTKANEIDLEEYFDEFDTIYRDTGLPPIWDGIKLVPWKVYHRQSIVTAKDCHEKLGINHPQKQLRGTYAKSVCDPSSKIWTN